MKSFDTDLKKYADKVRLKASERKELRERVLSYMEYHPLPKSVDAVTALPTMLDAEPFTVIRFTRRTMRFVAGFAVITLIAVPFAAERSVPGEVLYLIKTGITEPVQGQLVTTPYEKIEFETKLIERRIAEARSLASQGKLTEDMQTQLVETVKERTKSVASKIEALEAKDADGAAIARIAFNSSLEVQSAVLNAESGEDTEAPIESIRTAVNEARGEATVAIENEPAPSFEGLLARVELETTRAYELFESVKQSATPDEARSIERRLEDINRLITESKEEQVAPGDVALLATETEADAAVAMMSTSVPVQPKLTSTLGLIQKLIVFMTDIDVRETVTLDTLVPVVLSDAERATNITNALSLHVDAVLRITTAIELIDDASVVEKIVVGLERAEALKLEIESLLALDAPAVDAAEVLLVEMTALVGDLEAITIPFGEPGMPIDSIDTNPADAQGTTTASTTPETTDGTNTPELAV